MNTPSKPTDVGTVDEQAFVALIVRHERRVRAFIKALLPLDKEVDDLVQEVCVVAWQKFRGFRYLRDTPDEEFVTWLCTIAKFQVLNERKKRLNNKVKVLVPFDDTLLEDLSALQLQQSTFLEERRHALTECLNKLTGREREIIRLRYGLGEPIATIAAYLGREKVTAYQAVARLRSRLLDCVHLSLKRGG